MSTQTQPAFKNIITAESWNGTEFYFNWHKQTFEMCDNVDIWANDHFEAELADKDSATDIAEKEGLRFVKTEAFHH